MTSKFSLSALYNAFFGTTRSSGKFSFEIVHRSRKKGSRARVGRITTPHGSFETPSFVPVGTNASMKCLSTSKMDEIYKTVGNGSLMFCNTYHLMLHPGPEIIQQAGGLHKFMNHSYPLITDSGGFQVFSLAYGSVHREISTGKKLDSLTIEEQEGLKKRRRFASGNSVVKISEDGVIFRSYRDGRKILLTPEISIQAQKAFGADIIIPFDELPPYHMDLTKLKESLDRTHRWQKRSLDEHLLDTKQQAIYGIVHGGMNEDFRSISSRFVNENAFDGTAIGGSLGKNRNDVYHITNYVTQIINLERPVHLLGIGDIESIDNCIPCGIDTFDSAYPTRCARHGLLFTHNGPVKISRSFYKNSAESLDSNCPCELCKNHSLGYIHHLFKANEPTFSILASEHNITHYFLRMQKYRQQILNNEI